MRQKGSVIRGVGGVVGVGHGAPAEQLVAVEAAQVDLHDPLFAYRPQRNGSVGVQKGLLPLHGAQVDGREFLHPFAIRLREEVVRTAQAARQLQGVVYIAGTGVPVGDGGQTRPQAARHPQEGARIQPAAQVDPALERAAQALFYGSLQQAGGFLDGLLEGRAAPGRGVVEIPVVRHFQMVVGGAVTQQGAVGQQTDAGEVRFVPQQALETNEIGHRVQVEFLAEAGQGAESGYLGRKGQLPVEVGVVVRNQAVAVVGEQQFALRRIPHRSREDPFQAGRKSRPLAGVQGSHQGGLIPWGGQAAGMLQFPL